MRPYHGGQVSEEPQMKEKNGDGKGEIERFLTITLFPDLWIM